MNSISFNEKKCPSIEASHEVPMVTFCGDDGRKIALPYSLLSECTLSVDGKMILADFGDVSAIVVGEHLDSLHESLAAHKLQKIQAVAPAVNSVEVGVSAPPE